MKLPHVLRVIALFWLAIAGTAAAAEVTSDRRVRVGPVPEWVRSREWVRPAAVDGAGKADDRRYLLYELQEHPGKEERFVRIVQLMQNEAGVQDSGSLSLGFSPEFEELMVHRVQVHRAGQIIDRLDEGKIKLLQRERDLDDHVITGRQTALIIVEDLRVGDVLEYAYTTRGANPILAGHYATRQRVQSATAVDRQRVRVVWPAGKPLHLRQHALEAPVAEAPFGDGKEYVWDFDGLKSIPWEDFLPRTFEPHPLIELSDFGDWSRVVEWALPLYRMDEAAPPPELAALLNRWRTEGRTRAERAVLALQFVQDDLRYTGLELGPDSYRPAPPYETFEKRFGDCKGKVVLLCRILHELGIEAHPALVNTWQREGVADRLPSPFAFDHVIARVVIDGRAHWVDPTQAHQGGPLAQRHLPPYGRALVIRPGAAALENVTAPAAPPVEQLTESTFHCLAYDRPARFTVRTLFRGAAADDMRATLARSKIEDVGRDYLNYYAKHYPAIRATAPMTVADKRAGNELTLVESYEVSELWKPEEGGRRLKAEFTPESIVGLLRTPSTRLRQMPLALPRPMRRDHEITVEMPDKIWRMPVEEKTVEHVAFRFAFRRTSTESVMRFRYECETRGTELPAGDVAGYLAKVKEVDDLIGRTLYYTDPTRVTPGVAGVNWLMVVVAIFGVMASAGSGWWYWRNAARAPAAPAGEPPPLIPALHGPVGLGGWLVLVGFNLCLGPVITLVQMGKEASTYFSNETWQAVAMPGGAEYHALYAPLLISELLGNIFLIALNLLAVALFFGRRRAFPWVYIALLLFNAAFQLGDVIVGSFIPAVAQQQNASAARDLARAILGGAIWISYALLSKRVKATFVR